MYDTINPNLITDLSLILSKINDNINDSFYRFDPIIKFNENGYEIIPEHFGIFYGDDSIVRNFRNIDEIKEIDSMFCEYNLKHTINIIDDIKKIKFKNHII